MNVKIGGIEVEYPVAGGPVKVSGSGDLSGIALFELYSVLRSIYNQQNLVIGRDRETKVLRGIKLPPVKADKRL